MNATKNYKLNQWSAEDLVLRTDFNADNTKIEAALTGLNTSINTLNSSVSTIDTNLSKKASTTSLNSAVSRISSLESGKVDKTAHSSDVSALRSENCWVKLGSSYITTEGGKPSVSISNISQYLELRIAFHALSNSKSSGSILLSFNGGEPEQGYLLESSSTNLRKTSIAESAGGAGGKNGGTASLFPIWKGGVGIESRFYSTSEDTTIWVGSDYHMVCPNISWENIRSISLSGYSPLVAGSGMTVYGLKK